jgi:hypothetical protein
VLEYIVTITTVVSQDAANQSVVNHVTAAAIAARRVATARRMANVATNASALRSLPRLAPAEPMDANALIASAPTTRLVVLPASVLSVSRRQDAALVSAVSNLIGFG